MSSAASPSGGGSKRKAEEQGLPSSVDHELDPLFESIHTLCVTRPKRSDAELHEHHVQVMNQHLAHALIQRPSTKPLADLDLLLKWGATDYVLAIQYALTRNSLFDTAMLFDSYVHPWMVAAGQSLNVPELLRFLKEPPQFLPWAAVPASPDAIEEVVDQWKRQCDVPADTVVAELVSLGLFGAAITQARQSKSKVSVAVLNEAVRKAAQHGENFWVMQLMCAGADAYDVAFPILCTKDDEIVIYEYLDRGVNPTPEHLEQFIKNNIDMGLLENTKHIHNMPLRVIGRFIECGMPHPVPGSLAHRMIRLVMPQLQGRRVNQAWLASFPPDSVVVPNDADQMDQISTSTD